MKVKVRVIKDAYYDLEYVKAGRIIEFKGDALPSWATLADGVQTKQGKKSDDKKADANDNPPCVDEKKLKSESKSDVLDNAGQDGQGEGETPVNPDEAENANLDNAGQNETEQEKQPENDAQLPDVKKAEYLEELINEGIEKGILIDDADKKSVDEQIAELEKALNK